MRTILTILLTSLFWIGVFLVHHYATIDTTNDATTQEIEDIDLSEAICGYWEAVEGTTNNLEITKYGTIVRIYNLGSSTYEDRNEYKLSGNKLNVYPIYDCKVKVFKQDGVTYLEVYGHQNYAGKYRKVER
jgi:hypothetical protein